MVHIKNHLQFNLGIISGLEIILRSGEHFQSEDHLRYNLGIICGSIWGSFPVWRSFAMLYSSHIFHFFGLHCSVLQWSCAAQYGVIVRKQG